MNISHKKIAVIGQGYVGLPLAIELGKVNTTIGFDINQTRIDDLMKGSDTTNEITINQIKDSKSLTFSSKIKDILKCNIYIITVPTPIDDNNKPDLSPLIEASRMIGELLNKGNLVIYESTVYPGATEEICVPLLEKFSELKYNKDFYCGYSPERINPGDKQHTISNIKKVTSGSTPDVANFVDKLYKQIIKAGTHKTSSIKVAEAAKVIENTQRDVNIALINELSIIFNRLDVETEEVLRAAGSKWNFLNFRPGLVGGHCIGVDPYYLTYKAMQLGYNPEMILAGRRINDNMALYIADQVIKLMMSKRIHVIDSNILVLGLAFKENCSDLRNSKVINLIKELEGINSNVDVYDPWVNKDEANINYEVNLIDELKSNTYDAIIIAVSHDDFLNLGINKIKSFGKDNHIVYDIKNLFYDKGIDGSL
jgi:UDP-N-acetyl-D-glucosamine/UDP-N-acetyl-D-galactosamine dehydrogenase